MTIAMSATLISTAWKHRVLLAYHQKPGDMESPENNRMLQNSRLQQEPSLDSVMMRVGRRGWNVRACMRDYQPTIIFKTREVTNPDLCFIWQKRGSQRLPSGEELECVQAQASCGDASRKIRTSFGEHRFMINTYLIDNHRIPKQPLD